MHKNQNQHDMAKKQARNLIILTAVYFVIEIIVNFSVYRQLSISSDRFTAETMEFWGKGIAGVGLALICTRFLLRKPNNDHTTYGAFFGICLITVPLSFILQTALISYVVDKSSEEDRNKAILITATHGTLVPFFGVDHWSKKFDISTQEKLIYPFFKWMSYRHELYRGSLLTSLSVTKPCALIMAEKMGITDRADKAFFPYMSFIKDIDEAEYKQVIKDYYLCTYKDEGYFKSYSIGKVDHSLMISKMHMDSFTPAIDRYDEYKQYENNLKEAKKVADKAWRQAMDEMFGFKTTIKPERWTGYFFDHPDVRRMYEEKTGLKNLHPTDKDFKEKAAKYITDNLPESAIPAYKDKSGEPSYQHKELTDEEITKQGKKAYKAIIMPMIALGLSAFFLITNLTLAINAYLTRRFLNKGWLFFRDEIFFRMKWSILFKLIHKLSPKSSSKKLGANHVDGSAKIAKSILAACFYSTRFLIRKSFLILAFLWVFVLPLSLNGGAYDDLDSAKYKNTMKWLYFNEGNLIRVYDLFIEPVNKVTNYIAVGAENAYNSHQEASQKNEEKRIEKIIQDGRTIFDHSEK